MINVLKSHALFATSALLSILAIGIAPAEAITLFDYRSSEVVGFVGSDFDNDTLTVEFGTGFELNTGANISQILWSGTYGPANTRTPSTDNFSIRLFTVEGVDDYDGSIYTAPLATLTGNIGYFVQSVQLYKDSSEYDVYFYTLSLVSPFSLNPGRYLLSIMNDTRGDLDDNWGWTRNARGGARFRFDVASPWDQIAGGLDVAIEGSIESDRTTIPTPSLLPGLVGLGVRIWRKRKVQA